jgi:alpha-L-rhamnosidase
MVEIERITVEHHGGTENLGIPVGAKAPRISWRFSGETKDWTQSAYEIEILTDSQTRLFRVNSSESVLVPWPTTPLKARESVAMRVRAHGGSDSTLWSGLYPLQAGLLNREDWTAKLIAANRNLTTHNSLRPTRFRKSFTMSRGRGWNARLYITSYGVYEAYINGKRVGDHVLSPGWTAYKYYLNYQTFDVKDLLNDGENTIGVEVAEGWYSGRLGFNGGKQCIYGDRLALLAQLEITFPDAEELRIVSDETWKIFPSPIMSSELYDGEAYDASLEIEGWSSPSYKDELWSSVEPIDFPTAKLQCPEGPPIRKTETVKAQKVFKTPTGKTVVDFGQNLVGWLRVRVSGPEGHTITFTHTEVLEHGEAATRPLRQCKATDSLTLAGKPIAWEPKFTFHGFRYVQVDNWPSNNGEPLLGDLEAVVVHTDMEQTGWFECSEPMVNKLHENIRWGMRGNFVSIPTDCPQRDERLGWTGDIQIFTPTANFLYDTSGMLSGWLKDLSVEQIDELNGVVPVVVPNILPKEFAMPQAAWSDAAIIVPWDLFQSFGDRNILLNQHESMKVWLEKGVARQENGLWNPNGHQLGDWLDPAAPPSAPGNGKTDPHLVANAYLVHVTTLMARVSEALALKEDAEHYTTEAARLKIEFQNEYITPNGRLAPDTMTSLALAIVFGLFATQRQKDRAAERLDRIVRSSNFKIATGFVGTPIILPALTQVAKTQLAYRMLLEKKCPSWLYPITMGATTVSPCIVQNYFPS